MKGDIAKNNFKKKSGILVLAGGLLIFTLLIIAGMSSQGFAAEGNVLAKVDASIVRWAFLSAAIAVGLGSIAGGLAVAYVGAAALGAIGEKPELAGRALIFVGLAEGIAIYGLIIAIMILGKI